MLKLTITDLENDRSVIRFGSDEDLLRFIHHHYPVAFNSPTFAMAVAALQGTDRFDVEYDEWQPDRNMNRLPEDYQTHSQRESADPWPRTADRETS